MESEIRTFSRPDGEIQRVQILRWDRWEQLEFFTPPSAEDSLDRFAEIYRNFLVPAAPWLFGHMVLFRLPGELAGFSHRETRRWGQVADPLTAAAVLLQQDVSLPGGRPVFRSQAAGTLWEALEKQDCLRIVSGRLPTTKIIPVTSLPGYLTEERPDAAMKVNASFFIMDRFDCATVYDQVGTPFGLCVKNGRVLYPPLYRREALLVRKNGEVRIRHLDVTDLDIQICGHGFRHGKNATLCLRPEHSRSPGGWKQYLVITGCHVAAVSDSPVPIPTSGFVLCHKEDIRISPGAAVTYCGLEDVVFGIQVGNSILKEGRKTTQFHSRFYNIRHLEPVPFPPSLYPMDFDRARAARIALGADKAGKPMLLWAEGAAKIGHIPGQGSCGASLKEMAEICTQAGMHNAVNLDGGGSAQILIRNQRMLQISDRDPRTLEETQRPVPLGLLIP